jgi:hypothetical protein
VQVRDCPAAVIGNERVKQHWLIGELGSDASRLTASCRPPVSPKTCRRSSRPETSEGRCQGTPPRRRCLLHSHTLAFRHTATSFCAAMGGREEPCSRVVWPLRYSVHWSCCRWLDPSAPASHPATSSSFASLIPRGIPSPMLGWALPRVTRECDRPARRVMTARCSSRRSPPTTSSKSRPRDSPRSLESSQSMHTPRPSTCGCPLPHSPST